MKEPLRFSLLVLAAITLGLGLSSQLRADDLVSPPWGEPRPEGPTDQDPFDPTADPLTYFVEWADLDPQATAPQAPTREQWGPFGGPGTDPYPNSPSATAEFDGESGYFWTFTVPNWIDREPEKCLQLQLTFTETFTDQPSGDRPFITEITAFDNNEVYVYPGDGSIFLKEPPSGDTIDSGSNPTNGTSFITTHETQMWGFYPNPDYETINLYVPGHLTLDQVVVDTISMPEPTSAAAIALGGLALLRRRKR